MVAIETETQMSLHCASLAVSHHFVPVAVETAGPFGPQASSRFQDIGKRIKMISGDPQFTYYNSEYQLLFREEMLMQ